MAPEWIGQTHERILEYVEEHEYAEPRHIGDAINTKPNYVSKLCGELVDAGFLQRVGRGVYRITDDGRAFLAGDLDASDLPRPDP